MLEQETERILNVLQERTIGSGSGTSLHDVLAANIPRGIKAFLQAEVMQWLRDDLKNAPHFARTVDSTGAFGSLNKAFLRTLSEQYRFERTDFLGSLENAVHFLENYLCRPRWTLENFILENREEISVESLLAKLGYLYDYGYFRELIERFARGRDSKQVGAAELRSLITSIDEEVTKQHSPKELALLARPIFEFLLLNEDPMSGTIPVAAVLVFFDDKKMNILKDYVESICHIRNRTAVSMSDLTSLIEDLRLGTATTEAPAQPSPPPAPKEAADDELAGFRIESTTVEKQQVPARSADPPPPTPKSGKIPPPPPEPKVEAPAAAPEQAPPEPNPPPAPVQEEPESSRGEQETAREKQNIPLSLTFAGLKKPSEEPQLPDLNTMIPDDQRQRFIRKVFRRDEKYYMGIIAALNKTRNWKEASHYLNKLYQVNRFDPFAKEIVEFTDAIQKRYEPTGKHP